MKGADEYELAERLRSNLAGIDVVIQPSSERRKRLFLADMDSTMIAQECIDELADYSGLKAHVATITDLAMQGKMAFDVALRERVALLKGLPISVIHEFLRDRIRLTPGARTLLATMRANGAYSCLVSGSFSLIVDRVATMIGFDASRANTLIISDEGSVVGNISEPIFGSDGKRATLIELRQQLDLDKTETMAIGDGANDIDMILEAGLGVAYHGKPNVAMVAPMRIDFSDLTALLYVQGYRQEEFVTDNTDA